MFYVGCHLPQCSFICTKEKYFYLQWLLMSVVGAQSAWQMLHEDSNIKITTFSADIDYILGGGISCKEVTEIGFSFPNLYAWTTILKKTIFFRYCILFFFLVSKVNLNCWIFNSFWSLGGIPGIGKTQFGYDAICF